MTKRILAAAAAGVVLTSGLAFGTVGTAHAARPALRTTDLVTLHAENGSKVSGMAELTYSSQTGITTVSLRVSGLTPMTMHPAHLHIGSSCTANGAIKYPFRPLIDASMMMSTEADANGVMLASSSFAGNFTTQKLYINVHQGPTLKTASQAKPIACGVVNMM